MKEFKHIIEYNELMKEWNWDKNQKLNIYPNKITKGSHKNVWWKCNRNHEWQDNVPHRISGRGCPYCSNHRVLSGYNDLATINPKLAREWNYEKNNISIKEVFYKSSKKVWWKCSKCGYEWIEKIISMNKGKKCPQCYPMKYKKKYDSIAISSPELLKEWDYDKNNILKLDPYKISKMSDKKAWWKCEKGHEWQTCIKNRTRGHNCPYCDNQRIWNGENDFATKHPNLMREWDYAKNKEINPNMIGETSSIKVWWKGQCGHKWKSTISNRSKGGNCPYCTNKRILNGYNDLASKNPKLAREWNYEKNSLLPNEVFPNSNKKVWWKCNKGHEWQATINSRNNNSGCPYCSNHAILLGYNDLVSSNPHLAKEWNYEKNKELKPTDFSAGSHEKVWWKCKICSYEWEQRIESRVRGIGCPKCFGELQTSFPEQTINYYLLQTHLEILNRYIFDKKEIDIFIPKYNIGIEYDGAYWHNTKNSFDREVGKYEILKKNKITLIRVKEKENKFDKNTCDILIYTRNSLDKTINELLEVINKLTKSKFQIDVNIDRDRIDIMEQYLRERKNNSFVLTNSNIISEWNYEKNKGLKPEYFSKGSKKIVWWKCKKGHEWQANIYTRTSGGRCPYCTGKRVLKGYNDLATTYPNLLKDWNYQKNIEFSPEEITSGSGKKVWWKCSKCGYEWKTRINHRTLKGRGCPSCSNFILNVGYNDLVSTNSELIKEWNYEKNGSLKPENFMRTDKRIVWWKCEHCDNEWENSIYNRAMGSKCPVCVRSIRINNRMKSELKNKGSLEKNRPELVKEWNYERNIDLIPENFVEHSNKKVWWKCEKGHEWQQRIGARVRGIGCPYCANQKILKGYNDLNTINPNLSKEWNHEKNGDLKPYNVGVGYTKAVWWRCKMGHEWKTSVYNRSIGSGCPYCARNRPKVVKQYDLNGKFLKSYESINQAKQETGASKISQVCLGKRKTSGGFIWKYGD